MVTRVSLSARLPPSLCVRLAAPMSDAWDRKWGHPARPFNKKGQAGPSSFTEHLCESTMPYRQLPASSIPVSAQT